MSDRNPVQLPADLLARLKRSKVRKTFGIKLSVNGEWLFMAPAAASDTAVLRAWRQLAPWLAEKQQQIAAMAVSDPIHRFSFAPSEEFFFCGEKYKLHLDENSASHLISFRDGILHTPSADPAEIKSMLEAFYRRQTRRIVTCLLEKRTAHLEAPVGSITITGARRRFGSCNSTGDLNFSWYLAMYPIELIELVVCHELAHRKQMNHSPAFYHELSKMLPDHRERDRRLKEWSRKLSSYPA